MGRLREYIPGLREGFKLSASEILAGYRPGAQVYYAAQSTASWYGTFLNEYQTTYPDDTSAVHSTIQGALDATTDGRGDVVIVMPGRYALTEKLTITKSGVALLGATMNPGLSNLGATASTSEAGLPTIVGASGADTIELGGSVDVAGNEIAYLDIRGAVDQLAIDTGGTDGKVYRAYIHDNGIGIGTSTGYSAVGISAGTAGYKLNSSLVEHNYFYTHTHASGINDGVSSVLYLQGRDNEVTNNRFNLGGTKATDVILEHATYKGGNLISENDILMTKFGDFSRYIKTDVSSDSSTYVKGNHLFGQGNGTMVVAVGNSIGNYASGYTLTVTPFLTEIVDNKIALGRNAGHSLVLGHAQPVGNL